ncbi:MAG: 1-deoxy-D-xylulose-5-phosphate synthase [Treponema sp.]|jgi:1-deoxy-D-xylulose-5-phosphate synthase|nr:1-deoxy-D-xylulose-5-phosphate synthase [Treponema sp.]
MQQDSSLLGRIKEPQDLRGLSFIELNKLAKEIRELIIATVSRNGGHLASNLGVVELTIALHRVFDSPRDMIVWDVGHQCYTHKLLTGRLNEFSGIRKENGLSGFPRYSESPHDWFNTGHASTSISAALGLLAAEKIMDNADGDLIHVAAVIGDGALTGGMAYEALSHAGQIGLPLIVILNDNKMSISPNVGGLSKYLSRLSMKKKYQSFRRSFDAMVKRLPYIGNLFFDVVVRLKRAVKAVFYTDNFFVDLGFEYVGPIDGHNIPLLCGVIKDAASLGKPVVIHVITRKGKGHVFAEDDPGTYHGVSSPKTETDNSELPESGFTEIFGSALVKAARLDKGVVAITAAMEKGTGLSSFRKEFPKRFFDTGIAEEHAITFAAGLARRGLKPVVALYSTFAQRGVDQVIHDVSLQKLPVVFALDRAGFVSDDGETHQGLFDISLFRSAPGMTILAPAGKEELEAMLNWALFEYNRGPVMIRYPKDAVPSGDTAFLQPIKNGRGVLIRASDISVPDNYSKPELCIIFTGSLYPQVMEAAKLLKAENISTDTYNLRFIAPVDEDHLSLIMNSYESVLIVEEGITPGGFGEYAAELFVRRGCSCRLKVLGIPNTLYCLGKRPDLLRRNGLDREGIAAAALKLAGTGVLAQKEAAILHA